MAAAVIKHATLTVVADDPNYPVGSDEWNEEHDLTGEVPIANGGTAATTAAAARTNLGLVIGTDVQAFDAQLSDIAALAVTDGNIIVGDGTNWVAESGATARTSLGLGTGNSPQFTAIELSHATANTLTASGGVLSIEGVALLTAAAADALFLTPAEGDAAYQPLDAGLTDIAGLAVTDSNIIVGNGTNWVAESGATARTSLGVDAAGTDNSTNVTLAGTPDYITIVGQVITRNAVDLAADVTGTLPVANGGSGRSTATAHAVLCGGTTDTAAHQSIAGVGTSGQVLTSNGAGTLPTFQAASGGGVNVGDNRLTSHENLIVKYVSATSVDIDADAVLVKDTNGVAVRLETVNLTAAITTAGANGLDTGTEAADTWYHIFVIYNGVTTSALLSVSATAPTLPSGYTHKGYVGAVYNNASSNFDKFLQRGNHAQIVRQVILNGGTATGYTAISVAAMVPPTAVAGEFVGGARSTSGTNTVTLRVSADGTTTTPDLTEAQVFSGSEGTSTRYAGTFIVNFSTAQQIDYYMFGTNAAGTIEVIGWVF